MDTFIARQPILDRKHAVQAYELLFRSGPEAVLFSADPNQASSKVIADSLLLPGLQSLTGGRTAYINVTRELLVRDFVCLLPPGRTVLEIVEAVEPDDEVAAACRRLREAGYRIALDDFRSGSRREALLGLVDIVKVDVLATDAKERKALARRLLPAGLELVAEKVETPEIHREALDLGYQLFQGYYFARPLTLAGRDIPAAKLSYLQILREIHKPELDLRAVRRVVEREVALSYKLLRYINAAFFGWRGSVRSIDHALALLGERELKRWAAVIAVAGMASEKPDELVRLALLRGRFCEQLAPVVGMGGRAPDYFLMGMFSLIDAILDYPLAGILEQIPLADDVKAALLGEPGPLHDALDAVRAYTAGQWKRVAECAGRLGIDEAVMPGLCTSSLLWCSSSDLAEPDRKAA